MILTTTSSVSTIRKHRWPSGLGILDTILFRCWQMNVLKWVKNAPSRPPTKPSNIAGIKISMCIWIGSTSWYMKWQLETLETSFMNYQLLRDGFRHNGFKAAHWTQQIVTASGHRSTDIMREKKVVTITVHCNMNVFLHRKNRLWTKKIYAEWLVIDCVWTQARKLDSSWYMNGRENAYCRQIWSILLIF